MFEMSSQNSVTVSSVWSAVPIPEAQEWGSTCSIYIYTRAQTTTSLPSASVFCANFVSWAQIFIVAPVPHCESPLE